ncbi:AAA family ATPase [Variovorax sp. J22P240]|uniref:AAA family ATPase n=1 Tax=Variovorax sp. J22P240 TaxID=3053514 RepID=UPI0025751A21|nr:AAA family ATPase [Variovorax sp. J22P240]MDM0002642.1 AAA family ATPase [Variovorax sp. J22P240]
MCVTAQLPDAVNPREPLRLQFDLFELDEGQARLTRGGQALALPPKAFAVLCELARQPDQLVGKEALLDAVWGHQYVTDSVLKTTISELRAVLGDDAKQPRYIETAARRGYRFIARALPLGAAQQRVVAATQEPGRPTPTSALIGRQAARNWLHAAWREAHAGRRQVVWLAGEAGIGKTTLIEHLIAELVPDRVALGQCVEQHGAGEPYLPLLEALGTLCRADAALSALLRSVAPTWLMQLPWLSNEAERETLRLQLVGTGQARMLRELGELLDQYTQQRPLLLVTEDLHWSDQATLCAIDHIARRRGPARLMWLASFRLAEAIAEDHPLKALRHELLLHRLARELLLDPFSERDVADCIARRCPGQPAPEALARRLHQCTDGLPLFVVNVIDELVSQGMPNDPARAASIELPIPESLAGVIERQVDRLAPAQRDLLQAASVCGVEFSATTVAEALQRDAERVGEICDDLAGAHQWLNQVALERRSDGSMEGRYAFRHALYRQVVYQRIGALTRAQLHGRVAASLQRRRAAGGPVMAAELALQFELGHDAEAAIGHYADAAESALRHFAPTEAMRLTTHALTLLTQCPDGAARDRLEMALLGPRVAASQLLNVTAPEALANYERVRALLALHSPWPDATSGIDIELGWIHFTAGEYDRAIAIATSTQAQAGLQANPVRQVAACNLLGTTLTYRGQLNEGRQWLQRGIAGAEGLGDRPANALAVVDLEVSLRCRLAQALSHSGCVDAARAQIDAAGARAARLGPSTRRLALIFGALLELRLGHAERVRSLAGQLQAMADEHAMAQAEGPARWLRGWALAQLGEPAAGHQLILDGDDYDTRLGLQRGRSGVLGHAAEALTIAGQWVEAQTQLDQALALAEKMGERIYMPDLQLLQARIEIGRGRPVEAHEAMRSAWREAAQQQATWLELSALVALGEACGARSAEIEALAAARARQREGAGSVLVARADALLGRWSGTSGA